MSEPLEPSPSDPGGVDIPAVSHTAPVSSATPTRRRRSQGRASTARGVVSVTMKGSPGPTRRVFTER